MGIRLGAKKVQSRGIFPGAKVVRGVDWRWNNQDGGEGKEGVVVELRNWKNLPKRGVLVSWDCAKKGTYRLGAKGKVSLFSCHSFVRICLRKFIAGLHIIIQRRV